MDAPENLSRFMHVPFSTVASRDIAAAINAAEQLSEPEAQLSALRELVGARSQSADAWFALGGCCDSNGLEDDAVPAYERALALSQDAAWLRYLHLQLGSTYRNVGRMADAHLLLSQGIERFPDFHVLRVMRAFVEHDLGRHGQAVRTLAELLMDVAPQAVAPYGRAFGYYKDEL
jgi:tetratricopeptide (TPR) repeat protein